MTRPLQWRNNECDCVLNHQRLDSLLNRLSRPDQENIKALSLLAFVRGIRRWIPLTKGQ